MEYQFQIGDEFKIKPIQSRSKNVRCKYPDKTFTVEKIAKSWGGSIFYKDTRTNKKCKCSYCKSNIHKEYNHQTGEMVDTGLKLISPFEIILIRSNLQRIRELKLKLLNI